MDSTFPALAEHIRDVPDFPRPGILYKDITPLLGDAEAFRQAVGAMAAPFRDAGITGVAGAESRGFIFGAAIAAALGAGFIPIRKPGKLPWKREGLDYTLEYGSDRVEVHEDAAGSGDRVLLVDDLLATGGTLAASAELLSRIGASPIGICVLIELGFLGGRARLPADLPFHSVIRYD